ncbi:type VII secretion-associated serine protease mycosin [Tsukamurella ocularis]|uniref:type VII secretion-associated serine protease mycosin n=1 Tax=Tsukamurella ocularis TaxID=1970234 RepID=UPI002167DB6C|nr:type VII secretion-associated serine protease mycosin [Tsukamurella ocularis]
MVAVIGSGGGIAAAVTPPVVDPHAVPRDTEPGGAMRKTAICTPMRLAPKTDTSAVPAAQKFMRLPELWKVAGDGAGVKIGMIDTGVNKSNRFPRLSGGGDYVVPEENGLADCDAHGTTVATILNAAPSSLDGVVGVAPGAELISIRQTSGAYAPQSGSGDQKRAGDVASLAKAVVRLANAGAKVINISVVACFTANKIVDQTTLGAALRYAAIDKDALIVAAAGNIGEADCQANPDVNPTTPKDYRNWAGATTVATPAWFSDYVLSVAVVDPAGAPQARITAAGPWVTVAAPATPGTVASLASNGRLVNEALDGQQAWQPLFGTSFAAPQVAGLAAVLRAKFPKLTANQIAQRIIQTAHNPSAGVDNLIGYGVIDPLAAATFDVPLAPAKPDEHLNGPLEEPAPAEPADRRPMLMAVIGSAVVLTAGVVAIAVSNMLRRRKGNQ